MIKGITSSMGAASGKILVLEDRIAVSTESLAPNPDLEIRNLQEAISESHARLAEISKNVRAKIGAKFSGIFEAQELILEDPEIISRIKAKILEKGISARLAIKETITEISDIFSSIEDKTLSARVDDVRDVGNRLIRGLAHKTETVMSGVSDPVIIVAKDLLPSQTAEIDTGLVLAIVTENGGVNSHSSILARSLGIPAVVGAKGIVEFAKNAGFIAVDGTTGSVWLDPGQDLLDRIYEIQETFRENRDLEKNSSSGGRFLTSDGVEIGIFANAGIPGELNAIKDSNVKGVGMLRSEFLLSGRNKKPESQDFALIYKNILEFLSPKPVSIRLLDLGGDKIFPFYDFPDEFNPALGLRGIRYLLANEEILRSQILGIIEANTDKNAGILVPMVTDPAEIRKLKKIIDEIYNEIKMETGISPEKIPIGIMIETPAAAIAIEKFLTEVDFVSIGTNDLTQYVTASDRDNIHVHSLYNCLSPAVLKLIDGCVKAASAHGIMLSVCGEMASDAAAIPVLLGLGVRNLSVSSGEITKVREIIKSINLTDAEKLAENAMQ